MELQQELITAARKLRADDGLDKKLEIPGVLFCLRISLKRMSGWIEIDGGWPRASSGLVRRLVV